MEYAARLKAEKIRMAMEKIRDSNIKKVMIFKTPWS